MKKREGESEWRLGLALRLTLALTQGSSSVKRCHIINHQQLFIVIVGIDHILKCRTFVIVIPLCPKPETEVEMGDYSRTIFEQKTILSLDFCGMLNTIQRSLRHVYKGLKQIM